MGRKYCVVCSNFTGKKIEKRTVSLHRVPADKKMNRAWSQRLTLVRKDLKLKDITDNTRVCSEHFVQKGGPVPGDDVPSLFENKTFKTNKASDEPQPMEVEIIEESSSTSGDVDNCTEAPVCSQNKLSLPAFSLLLHDYDGPVDSATIINSEKCVALCEANFLKPITSCADTQTETVTTDAVTQTDEMPHLPMRYEYISGSDETVRLYTGLPNKDIFQFVFDELAAVEPRNDSERGRKKSLRGIDEFLLVMMRLKLGLVLADLSFRFKVSRTTCSRIIQKWVDLMYVQLSFLTHWPTRNQINNTMPIDFKQRFPNTRVVIDCTEIFTETPRSLAHQSMMWSQYKSHMTWKALIGITPNGVVCFVSDLWTGSISDKQIVDKSGLVDLCEPGDAIMGDKGFLISEFTTPKEIELIIPPRKASRKQMSKRDTELTRRVANCRIHVERHMERVKNWRVLHNLAGTMKSSVSQIWHVCNNLTALLPPLHPHNGDSLPLPEPLGDDDEGSESQPASES